MADPVRAAYQVLLDGPLPIAGVCDIIAALSSSSFHLFLKQSHRKILTECEKTFQY